jgi:hypothetical protein
MWQKQAEKELNARVYVYRKTNVGHEMYDSTGNNPNHGNSNKRLKERFGSHTRKTLNSFTTKHICTWNITHNTENAAVRNLEPQQWRSAGEGM